MQPIPYQQIVPAAVHDDALWCAASLVSRSGYRVRVVMPRAAGVVREARRAARDLEVQISVAITSASISVHLGRRI
jgi:hypothetical protein